MAEPVLDGLANHRGDPRHRAPRTRSICSRTSNRSLPRLNGDFDLGVADRLGVLVTLGPAGASRDRPDTLDLDELLLDLGRKPIALDDRRAGRREQEDGERALVERGEERAAERTREQERRRSDESRAPEHPQPEAESQFGERARTPASAGGPGNRLGPHACCRGLPLRRKRHIAGTTVRATSQRGEDRNHVGQRQRLEKPAFEPLQKQQRHEHHHDDDRREHHRRSDLIARVEDDLSKRALL